MKEVVLGVDRDQVEQRPESLLDLEKAPDRDDHVDEAEGERVRSRRIAGRKQAEQAGARYEAGCASR